ncbi:MAG: hypothetical protein GY839_11910 [candidate division Zixibacteria bacterium]|nr:hypothetical protein [candidate division Zixibacteria bacterium]
MRFRCKELICVLVVLLCNIIPAFAEVPSTIGYQGRLLTADGEPFDGNLSISFSIFDAEEDGTELWIETQDVFVVDSFFDVFLGSVTPLDLTVFGAPADELFLQVQVLGELPMSPRLRFGSVPFSSAAQGVRGDIETEPGKLTIETEIVAMNLRSVSGSDTASVILRADDGRSADVSIETEIVAMNLRSVSGGDTASVILRADDGKSANVFIETEIVAMNLRSAAGGDTTTLDLKADSSGSELRMNKSELVDAVLAVSSDPDSGGARLSMESHDAAMSIINNMRAIAPGGDSSGITVRADSGGTSNSNFTVDSFFDITYSIDMETSREGSNLAVSNIGSSGEDGVSIDVDDEGSSLRMNKGELTDAIASGVTVVADSGGTRNSNFTVDSFFDITYSIDMETSPDGSNLAISNIGSSGEDGVSIDVDDEGSSLRMNKGELIDAMASEIADNAGSASISRRAARTGRNPQTGATINLEASTILNDTTGGSFTLRRLDDDSDGDVLTDMLVTGDSASFRCLSKADAKRALEALVTSTSVGLTLIDSTLNDSGLIDLRIDDSGGSGVSIRSAKKVARFKAGAALASSVNIISSEERDGAYLGLGGELDRFVEIVVDSASSNLVFSDTLGDTTLVLRHHEGADGSVTGRIRVIAPNTGTGMPSSNVAIADLDSDGLMDLQVDGNVGIGTDRPNMTLDVRGEIGNNSVVYHSDKRWKKNINTIPDALNKVNQLRGVSFDWRKDEFSDMNFSNGRQIGLIAQEVEAVIPELVRTDKDGYKSVEYADLVAVLIEAVKEQQKTIKNLQSEITEARYANKQVQSLQSQVNQMQTLIRTFMSEQQNSGNLKADLSASR